MAKAPTRNYYTLTQHSGFAHGRKKMFEQAVEETSLATLDEANRVMKANGLIFNTYDEAHARAHAENYPASIEGLVPQVKGTFHPSLKIDGKPIYIPAEKS